jgi:hypothetical protein
VRNMARHCERDGEEETVRETVRHSERQKLARGRADGKQLCCSPVYVPVVEAAGSMSVSRTRADGLGLTQATAGEVTTYTLRPVSREGLALAQCGVAFVASLACAAADTACTAAHARTLTSFARTYGDGEVANRDIRVWHGATENRP